jgi:hypothetical protein
METHKPFSHGLLYSIPPDNISSLHLQDEGANEGFEWGEFKAALAFAALARRLLSLLKK